MANEFIIKNELIVEGIKQSSIGGTLLVDGYTTVKNNIIPQSNGKGPVNITMTETDYKSNTTITVDASTASQSIVYTLPTPTLGLRYNFICSANAGTSTTVRFSAPSAVLGGFVSCSDGGKTISGAGASSITNMEFGGATFKKHSNLEFISDGTSWFVSGFSLGLVADITTS